MLKTLSTGEFFFFFSGYIRNIVYQILEQRQCLCLVSIMSRDIKGANILVDPSGRVKLADFGMAKHVRIIF